MLLSLMLLQSINSVAYAADVQVVLLSNEKGYQQGIQVVKQQDQYVYQYGTAFQKPELTLTAAEKIFLRPLAWYWFFYLEQYWFYKWGVHIYPQFFL